MRNFLNAENFLIKQTSINPANTTDKTQYQESLKQPFITIIYPFITILINDLPLSTVYS